MKSCLLLTLCKRLCCSMENISALKVPACPFLSAWPARAVPAARLLDSTQACACIVLRSAPWVIAGDVHFAVLVPNHRCCEHELLVLVLKSMIAAKG